MCRIIKWGDINMEKFKDFIKTSIGKLILVIGIIILVGVGSVILNNLIEEINYKNISIVVGGQSDSTEKKIKKELAEMIKEYQSKYGGEYFIFFDNPVADEENAVEINIFYDKGEVSDGANGLPAILYKKIVDYSSKYINDPFVEVTVKERQNDSEDPKVIHTKSGYDDEDYVASKETVQDTVQDTVNESIEIIDKSIATYNNETRVNVTVKNNTNKTTGYIRVDVFFYDSDGNQVDTEWTNTSDKLKPGGTMDFKISVKNLSSSVEKYSIEVTDVSYD